MIGRAPDSNIRKANEAALAASFARHAETPPDVGAIPPPKSGKTYQRFGLMPDLSRFYHVRPSTRGASGMADQSYTI